MNEILILLLSLSISASLIALILFALKPLYQNRLSKTWQYYIWLVVVARLLLPFAPETNLMGYLFQNTEQPVELIAQPEIRQDIQPTIPAYTVPNGEAATYDASDAVQTGAGAKTMLQLKSVLKQNLFTIWLVVALVLFVRKLTSYLSFARYIRAGSHEIDRTEILDVYFSVCEELGVSNPIPIYENKLASSPMLVGMMRPCIVLPELHLSTESMRLILCHELIHHKRRDILYKWLVQLALCFYWFNPLIYFVSREINRNCELSCDEAVIAQMADIDKQQYGDTLLATVKTGGAYGNAVASITLTEDGKNLKERLQAILKHRSGSTWTKIAAVVLSVGLLCGASFAGAYAGANRSYAAEVVEDVQPTLQPYVEASANNTSADVTTLTGSNDVTVKSIGAGEVTCIGEIELGPDSAYTATLSIESGSGAMIALHDSPNVTKIDGTPWSLYYGVPVGSNIYFSSEQPKTAYVYVGSSGTKLTNVAVKLVQSKTPLSLDGNLYFTIKSNGNSVIQSGSFEAKDGQTLIITNDISIKKGSVDLFLFSPSGKEQRFTFGDNTDANAKGEIKVPVSVGTWAYNCTGFFESGNVVIAGTVTDAASTSASVYGVGNEYMPNISVPNIAESVVAGIVNKITDRTSDYAFENADQWAEKWGNQWGNQWGNSFSGNNNESWRSLRYMYADGYLVGVGIRNSDSLDNYSTTRAVTLNGKAYTVAYSSSAADYADNAKARGIIEKILTEQLFKGNSDAQNRTYFTVRSVIYNTDPQDLLRSLYTDKAFVEFMEVVRYCKGLPIIEELLNKAADDKESMYFMFLAEQLPDNFNPVNAEVLARKAVNNQDIVMLSALERFLPKSLYESLMQETLGLDNFNFGINKK